MKSLGGIRCTFTMGHCWCVTLAGCLGGHAGRLSIIHTSQPSIVKPKAIVGFVDQLPVIGLVVG